MTPELLKHAITHALSEYPKESAGVVIEVEGEARYWPCRNIAKDPLKDVDWGPEDLFAAEDAGRLLGHVHSHPQGNPEPSPSDKEAAELTQLPSWVVTPRGDWRRYDPRSRNLLQRQFVFGVDDCWSICRDWYSREALADLPDFLREQEFWRDGLELHINHLDEAGFELLQRDHLRPGDGLMFKIRARLITHSAVYLGEGQILHHIDHELSRREPLTLAWMKRLVKVARRKA